MGFFATIKRWFGMIFKSQAEEEFDIKTVNYPEMEAVIKRCENIYRGIPAWVDEEANVRTVNFAKSICGETARLAMLATSITVDGSERATWLQEQIDSIYAKIREWVEFGLAYGTIAVKPNGDSFDVFTPDEFIITECSNKEITGMIFLDKYSENDKYYARLEYHRFVDRTIDGVSQRQYLVSNRAYVSGDPKSQGERISLKKTKWKDLMEESGPIMKANGEALDGPMFGVFRTPQANSVDNSTPLGLPIFFDAIEELKDFDIAYSRNALEIFDSEKIVLLDDQLMFGPGEKLNGRKTTMKLPHYVQNVFGNKVDTFYQEINPQLNTNVRLEGINFLLSQIGFKCGYSNGYFVLNQKTGMVTATQVEADDRRTIQLIKDIRDQIEACIDSAVYALSVYADLYDLAPDGEYEITYDFGDITYNREEDRARWWGYVVQGTVPVWMYFNKFEGMSEEEAKAMIQEVRQDQMEQQRQMQSLFPGHMAEGEDETGDLE